MSIANAIEEVSEIRSGRYSKNVSSPFTSVSAPVIRGFFPREEEKKEMSIRKVNSTLAVFLVVSIIVTAVSYYFATANEIVLNDLSRQTVVLNDENADLQNKLDKLKSFNNVDMSIQHTNLLKKAQQVIEVQAVGSKSISDKTNKPKAVVWDIGY